MSVKRVECLSLVEDYATIECSVRLRNRTTTFNRITFILNYDVNPIFRFTLFYKFSNGMYRKFLVDITEDLCGYIEGKRFAPLMNLLWGSVTNYTNIEGCPLKKGVEYYIKDFVFDPSVFPPGAISGQYRVDIRTVNAIDRKKIFLIQGYAEVESLL
ncbi:uncharacterized protein LOC129799323 [Phlebotomus papatasi]|uniref:uncharacterized protein LOC129799323 n=1 Tax=Phlebotomus papatasi TaxID=29031 RepID=UPI0024843DFE|nr:uncharacterized protein LOC129799323 [Phlebotomus papatasi]